MHELAGRLEGCCALILTAGKAMHDPRDGQFLALQDVASISAGNDDFIGEMIADALDKVGSNGVLSIESSNRCVCARVRVHVCACVCACACVRVCVCIG